MAHDIDLLRNTLSDALPTMTVLLVAGKGDPTDARVADGAIMDGPVLVICSSPDTCTFALHCDDFDNIDALAGDVYQAIEAALPRGHGGGDSLAFKRAAPILDESDYRVGETLVYRHVRRGDSIAAE